MISKVYFRLKQNGEPYSRCICRDPELIENYDKAVADTTQTWEVHHRLESCFTQKFLKEMRLYYDVEPGALIFLTRAEHSKIDSRNKRVSDANKGKVLSEETKIKISEAKPKKKVLCVETGEVFESILEAERRTGISNSNISKVCNGKLKTAGRYHWKCL